jgi:hypothetical protein
MSDYWWDDENPTVAKAWELYKKTLGLGDDEMAFYTGFGQMLRLHKRFSKDQLALFEAEIDKFMDRVYSGKRDDPRLSFHFPHFPHRRPSGDEST